MGWDRDLQTLEEALRNLNALYDAFLFGSRPSAPVEVRRRVEQQIRRLSTAEAESPAERFRFSALQGRFNVLCERWDRLQEEKEAGRRPGVYSHFTRTGGGGFEKPRPHPNADDGSSVERMERPPDPSRERELYERYRAARTARGEDVSGLTFELFVERLARERERLKQQLGVTELEFDVAERDGRVRLIARPRTMPG
jgi:hypothetical protein